MTAIDELFGKGEAIIAMAHFPPMPGQPSCDVGKGVRGLRDAVAHDVEILGTSGVDAVMFCNERDRSYRTTAGPEVLAVMASVIAEFKRDLPIPFGVTSLGPGLRGRAGARGPRGVQRRLCRRLRHLRHRSRGGAVPIGTISARTT